MSLSNVASKCDVTSMDFRNLLTGDVSVSLARKFGVTTTDLQNFIKGNDISANLASAWKMHYNDLRALREEIGREGAIGLIIGKLLP